MGGTLTSQGGHPWRQPRPSPWFLFWPTGPSTSASACDPKLPVVPEAGQRLLWGAGTVRPLRALNSLLRLVAP